MNPRRSSLDPLSLAAAAGAGALLVYLLDPLRGRRRVALARDQATHLGQRTGELTRRGWRDLSHRVQGLVARWRGRADHAVPGDEVLLGRVRARLGRLVSHPHAVRASVHEGRVKLEGPVLRGEEAALRAGLRAVRGVQAIDDRLELHERGEHLPALQGGPRRRDARPGPLQQPWAPGPRLLALAAGSALALYGLGRRGAGPGLLGLAGLGLAARAAAGHRGALAECVECQKSVHVAAPPEAVFELWSDCENLPRFLSAVESVRPLDGQRAHWVARDAAGQRVEWDAVMRREPPHRLSWHSEPGGPVQHQGSVRLVPEGGGTRATVQLRWSAGAPGRAAAGPSGRHPRHLLGEDLLRMKAFVEARAPAAPQPAFPTLSSLPLPGV